MKLLVVPLFSSLFGNTAWSISKWMNLPPGQLGFAKQQPNLVHGLNQTFHEVIDPMTMINSLIRNLAIAVSFAARVTEYFEKNRTTSLFGGDNP